MEPIYCETYKEVKLLQQKRIRDYLREFALNGLSTLDLIRGTQKDLSRSRIQFLYVHHVFKDEEKKLELLLKRLALDHCFLSYSEAVTRILEGEIDKPYISISSDDGFKNNLRAAEILNNYGAKACFFINPGIVGASDFVTVKGFCRDKLRFPPVEFLDWDDIHKLLNMGHEIGSHTMNHINIAQSARELIKEECENSFQILKSRCGDVKHFAFPYGRFFHFNEMGRKTVFESGFSSCASAERGCHVNPYGQISNQELCILRDHVILSWNINHIFYFLANNSRKASPKNNYFPYV